MRDRSQVRGPILVLYKVELHQCCRLRRVDGLKPEVYVGGAGGTNPRLDGKLLMETAKGCPMTCDFEGEGGGYGFWDQLLHHPSPRLCERR